MRIRIEDIDGPMKSSKGRWQEIKLTYTDLQNDETKNKVLVNFGPQQPVFEHFASGDVGAGEEVGIQLKKDGKFWNWVGVEGDETSGASQPRSVSSGKSTGSKGSSSGYERKSGSGNWETTEERKQRQLSICRQNALTNAVNAGGGKLTEEQIIDLADKFFYYTSQDFGTTPPLEKIQDSFK